MNSEGGRSQRVSLTAPGISAPPPALGSTANDPTNYLFRPSCNILCRVGVVSIIKYKTNYLVSSRVSCTILHVVLYYLLYCCSREGGLNTAKRSFNLPCSNIHTKWLQSSLKSCNSIWNSIRCAELTSTQ